MSISEHLPNAAYREKVDPKTCLHEHGSRRHEGPNQFTEILGQGLSRVFRTGVPLGAKEEIDVYIEEAMK